MGYKKKVKKVCFLACFNPKIPILSIFFFTQRYFFCVLSSIALATRLLRRKINPNSYIREKDTNQILLGLANNIS
jgi:hypothetical protein